MCSMYASPAKEKTTKVRPQWRPRYALARYCTTALSMAGVDFIFPLVLPLFCPTDIFLPLLKVSYPEYP